MIKKFSLLTIAVLIAATSINLHASEYYGFKLGGVSVNSDNCKNITGSNIKAYDPSKPFSAVYTRGNMTLTLTNVKIERTGSDNRAIFVEHDGLNVVFEGTNLLLASDAAPVRTSANLSFRCKNGGSVTIIGGSEDAIYINKNPNADENNYRNWVYFHEGDYTIKATNSYAIHGLSSYSQIVFFEGIRMDIYGSKGDLCDLLNVEIFVPEASDGTSQIILRHNTSTPTAQVKNLGSITMTHEDPNEIFGVPGNDVEIVQPGGAYFAPAFKTIVYPGSDGLISDYDIIFKRAVPIDQAHFPDASFCNYLFTLQKTYPGFFTLPETKAIKTINASGRSISTLEGIGYFPNLENLFCFNNNLDTLDISPLTKLRLLSCASNNLTRITISHLNSDLTTFYCQNNKLTDLYLNYQNNLETLYCQDNELTSLTLPAEGANLKYLNCSHNNISYFVLKSSYESLKTCDCSYNNIYTQIHISTFQLLESLKCNNNRISMITGGNNPYLTTLDCNNNALTEIKTGNWPLLKTLNAYSNKINSSLDYMIENLQERTDSIDLHFADLDDANEQNSISSEQVNAMRAKKWIPYYRKDGVWLPYTSSLLGDVNCDGSVNAADVTALYNYILNGDTTYLATSDVNNDDAVNAGDVTAVYNIILGN